MWIRQIEGVAHGARSCKNPRRETELSDCPWIVSQIRRETHTLSGRRRRNRRCPGCVFERVLLQVSSTTMVHSFCLAAVMDGWPSFSRFDSRELQKLHRCLKKMATAHAGAFPSSNASFCLGGYGSTAHPSQPTSHGSFHPHLICDLHASVRAYGIEKERSGPAADATSPLTDGRDRSIRNWTVYQDRSPRWVGPHGQR